MCAAHRRIGRSPPLTETAGAVDGNDATDERVLKLRAEGRAFASIARELDLQNGYQAILGFRRALARRPVEERSRQREEELARLDRMAESVHSRSELSEEDVNARLATLDRVRGLLRET
jgi:hypothetical protein